MSNRDFLILAESLWIEVYERGFIELEDVYNFQRWLHALHMVGHTFTDLKPREKAVSKGTLNFNVGHTTFTTVPDLPSSCKNIPRKIFWTSDMHDGTRLDTPTVLAHLGQRVFIVGSKGETGPYPFVFQHENITIYKNINRLIGNTYKDHGYDLKQDEINSNYDFFKNDPVMKTVNGFFCQFPASMCQLWMPFNRSIMFTPAHRYDYMLLLQIDRLFFNIISSSRYNLGRCSPSAWDRLDRELKGLSQFPNNLIGGMSR